jgi:hypothetical protein
LDLSIRKASLSTVGEWRVSGGGGGGGGGVIRRVVADMVVLPGFSIKPTSFQTSAAMNCWVSCLLLAARCWILGFFLFL